MRVVAVERRPTAYAEMPRTEPIERSTLRVTMTMVSPIASSAMIDGAGEDLLDVRGAEEEVVVDRGRADDDHEREHDAELAEAEQELRDRVRAGARLDDLLLLRRRTVTRPRRSVRSPRA